MFTFYLGTHKAGWLADARFADVPLFVSRQTLRTVRRLPRAVGAWALDSGGFTELQLHGRWTVSEEEYVAEVRRYAHDVGGLVWAAPQDWMCEPIVIAGGVADNGVVFAGTGLSVEEHQRRTVANFLRLRELAPEIPWAPVLQGWTMGDYDDCAQMYADAGVNLLAEPLVGVGSVCRRQSTVRASLLLADLWRQGLRLHGFGFKVDGLELAHEYLASADSLAWSYAARKRPVMPGHDQPGPGRRTGHASCANCPEFALAWRAGVLQNLAA